VPEHVPAGAAQDLDGGRGDRLRLGVDDERQLPRQHELRAVGEVGPVELHRDGAGDVAGRERARRAQVEHERAVGDRALDLLGRHRAASSRETSPRFTDLIRA
jgi:hypothetical protein